MRPNEIGRFANDFLRVTNHSGVVGMLFCKFVECTCSRYLMFARECFRICVQ